MNYQKLSNQYFNQYKIISLYVKGLRKELKSLNGKNYNELSRRISILYTICLDLKHTSEHLKKCERRDGHVKH